MQGKQNSGAIMRYSVLADHLRQSNLTMEKETYTIIESKVKRRDEQQRKRREARDTPCNTYSNPATPRNCEGIPFLCGTHGRVSTQGGVGTVTEVGVATVVRV